jgi:cytosine/adenosine deaminase-related metal-dependent hydrolase
MFLVVPTNRLQSDEHERCKHMDNIKNKKKCDLLIHNAYVITMNPNREIYTHGAIAISGKNIIDVGSEKELLRKFWSLRTIDARGSVVHPGFVDSHLHASLHTTRGVFPEKLPFNDYTRFYWGWFDEATYKDEFAGCLLASLELLRNGVTCYMEAGSVLEPDAAADAAEAIGIRASLAEPLIWDIPENSFKVKRAPADFNRSIKLIGTQLYRNQKQDSLVRGHIAVFGASSASEKLMRAAKECADQNGAIFAMHQSFKGADTEFDDKRFGKHPLVYYKEVGLLGPNCSFTHMNVIRDDEIAPIVESGISVIRCPAGALNWRVGTLTRGCHPELHRKGVNVALCSDAARYGAEQQGYLEFMIARDKGGELLDPEDLIEMMTMNGSRAVGLGHLIGSLESGKRADMVIRTNDVPEVQPGVDLLQDIVLSSRSKSIDTVIVDGRIVLKNGHSVLIDENVVYHLAREACDGLMNRLGMNNLTRTRWPIIN